MTRADSALSAPGYRFVGPTTGLWLGLGAGRVATLSGGLIACIAGLAAHLPVPVAAAPAVITLLAVTVRIAGAPLIGWIAPATGTVVDAATGARCWRLQLPATPLSSDPSAVRRLRLPSEYGRLTVTGVDADRVGLLREARAGTAVVVFTVAGGDGLRLLDTGDQRQVLAAWAQALIGFAQADQVDRLQLVHRSRGPGCTPPPHPDSAASPLQHAVGQLAVEHDMLLAVRLAARSVRRGDPDSLAGLCRGLARQLLDADLTVAPLDPAELVASLLCWPAPPPAASVSIGGWGSRRSAWRQVSLDDQVTRGFAVTGWPRLPVRAGWLDPLLLACPARALRTVSLHLQPVPTAAALRRARAARAQADLDAKDRARLGFLTPAAEADAADRAVDLETELAAGHRAYAVAGLLTVTAVDLPTLDAAAADLGTAAALAGLQIRPLHGQHATALAASAPACLTRLSGTP